MLIVMAVAVVLAAATMPSISGQIEKSKESNDLVVVANAYASAFADASLTASKADYTKITAVVGGLTFQQKTNTWTVVDVPTIAGTEITVPVLTTASKSLSFEFSVDDSGKLTLSKVEAGTATTNSCTGATS